MDITCLEDKGKPASINSSEVFSDDGEYPRDDSGFLDEPDGNDELIKLRTLLKLYITQFEEELKDYNSKDIDNLSLSELQDLRSLFDAILSYSSTIKTVDKTVVSGLSGIENLLCDFGVKCHGLAGVLSTDKDYMRDVKIILFKHIDKMPNYPEARLALSTMYAVQALHKINTMGMNNRLEDPQMSNEFIRANSTQAPGSSIQDVDSSSLEELNKEYNDL